nr:hypothetical protein CoNPh38_CDS0227 [Staphylococcus phage S-CoN_Ph38]
MVDLPLYKLKYQSPYDFFRSTRPESTIVWYFYLYQIIVLLAVWAFIQNQDPYIF